MSAGSAYNYKIFKKLFNKKIKKLLTMDKKNTCWVFGDSFTQNLQLKDGSNLLRLKGIEGDYPDWPQQVADSLGMNCNVIARGGRSSQGIFTHALRNFKNYKKGDVVIVTDSPYVRIEGVDFQKKEITTYNLEQYMQNDFRTDEHKETHGVPISNSKSVILLDYLNEFILPFGNELESYWRDNLISLTDMLNSMGITSVYWSSKLWFEFDSISKETNDVINDDHWGIDGNNEFSKFLIKNIENKNYKLIKKSTVI